MFKSDLMQKKKVWKRFVKMWRNRQREVGEKTNDGCKD